MAPRFGESTGAGSFYDPYNPFLQSMQYNVGMPMAMGDLSSSGNPQATDVATQNRQFTAGDNIIQMLSNPYFNQMVAQLTGANTFDYSAFTPGGGVVGQNAGFNVGPNFMGDGMTGVGGVPGAGGTGGSGSGGGGSGGKSNGWDPYYDSSALELAANSEDPVIAGLAGDIGSVDKWTIKNQLRGLKDKSGALLSEVDPGKLDMYLSAVDDLDKAYTGKQKNDLLGQEMQARGRLLDGGSRAARPILGSLRDAEPGPDVRSRQPAPGDRSGDRQQPVVDAERCSRHGVGTTVGEGESGVRREPERSWLAGPEQEEQLSHRRRHARPPRTSGCSGRHRRPVR